MTLIPPPGVTSVSVGQTGHSHSVEDAQNCGQCQPYLAAPTNNEDGTASFLGFGWTPEEQLMGDALAAAVKAGNPTALQKALDDKDAEIAALKAKLAAPDNTKQPK